jgi:hypothetical protein
MGRRQGSYLGGSTIINPSRNFASSDEGPVAALERARLEKQKTAAESIAQHDALKAADATLSAAEKMLFETALRIAKSLYEDKISLHEPELRQSLIEAREEIRIKANNISSLGLSYKRRLEAVIDDYSCLIGSTSANASLQMKSLYIEHSTMYQKRIRFIRASGDLPYR